MHVARRAEALGRVFATSTHLVRFPGGAEEQIVDGVAASSTQRPAPAPVLTAAAGGSGTRVRHGVDLRTRPRRRPWAWGRGWFLGTSAALLPRRQARAEPTYYLA